MRATFRWVREDAPGPQWTAAFARTWPSYRAWFLREGDGARPGLDDCRRALRRYMPELVPLWERLVELAGGDPLVARMLSLYRPTPFLGGCSQAVWTRGAPRLVRNYDYHPALCEGTFLSSAWHGARVLAASDCLWGCLDGMNEHGLALALSYGGRPEPGDGFGIPLLLRYTLELCRTTAEACDVLRRVPSHMAYNVSVVDAEGEYAVVRVGPHGPVRTRREAVATNHQRESDDGAYVRKTKSKERRRYLRRRLEEPGLTADGLARLFLEPPLYASAHDRGFGTLYTAEYQPRAGIARYLWPGAAVVCRLDAFEPRDLVVAWPAAE